MAGSPTRGQKWWERVSLSPEVLVLTLAAVLGGGTGLCVVAFRWLIGWVHQGAFETLMGLSLIHI